MKKNITRTIAQWKSSSPFAMTYLLAGLLAVLVLVMVLVQDPLHLRRTDRKTPLIDASESTAITKIERTTESDGVTDTLTRNGDQWVVTSAEEAPATHGAVTDLLDALFAIERGEIASRTNESHGTLRVDARGTRIVLYRGDDVVSDLVIGKNGPDFVSTYVRKEGEELVYRHPENLRPLVGVPDFRDLTITSLSHASISKIHGYDAEHSVTLEKNEEGAWQVTDPLTVEVPSDISTPLLTALQSLTATDVHMTLTTEETGLVEPAQTLVITAGGNEITLLVGNVVSPPTDDSGTSIDAATETVRYVSRDGDDRIFSLPTPTIDLFPTRIADLEQGNQL